MSPSSWPVGSAEQTGPRSAAVRARPEWTVIGKVCRRGTDTRRLLVYLFTEGRAGERGLDSEHRDVRVIAGWDTLSLLEPVRGEEGRAQVSRLAGLLDAPVRAGGVGKDAKPVYHLAISAAPADRLLSDAEWADIAAEYVDQLGLARRGDSDAVRWVAVRHADNHVHVVATLVRQDGRRVFPYNDFYRSRDASRTVEQRYGLTPTSPADRTSGRETTRGELRKHQSAVRARAQAGLPPPAGPDREVLRGRVRAALAGSQGWEEFAERLRLSGVLVRERYSIRNPDEITGYAVALPTHGAGAMGREQSVWFGGGKLAPDLTFPQLQARWAAPGTADPKPDSSTAGRAHPGRHPGGERQSGLELTELERQQLWLAVQHAVQYADAQIRHANNPRLGAPTGAAATAAYADAQAAASAASEVLSAVSWLLERKRGGPLRTAADSYDRAARDLRRRTVPATPHSRKVRTAARELLSSRLVNNAETRQLMALLSQLSALTDSLARLRETQGRAAQAHAARQAAEQLNAECTRRTTAATAAAPTRQTGTTTGLPTSRSAPASSRAQRPPSSSR